MKMEYGGLVEPCTANHCEAHVTVAVSGHNIGLGFGSRKELRARAAHLALAIRAAASRSNAKNIQKQKKSLIIFDSSIFFKNLQEKNQEISESSYMFICSSRFFVQGSSCNVPVEFTIVHRFSTEVSWIGTVNLLEVSFAVCGLRVKTCPGSFCAECCQLSQVLESMCVCVFLCPLIYKYLGRTTQPSEP